MRDKAGLVVTECLSRTYQKMIRFLVAKSEEIVYIFNFHRHNLVEKFFLGQDQDFLIFEALLVLNPLPPALPKCLKMLNQNLLWEN